MAVIARTTDSKDRVWLKVRLPIRPNGTTGWVPENALDELQPVDTWLRIGAKTFKATLIKNGKRVFSAQIGSASRNGRRRAASSSSARCSRTTAPRARSTGRCVHRVGDVGHADRLARGRSRRHPRDERSGADTGQDLARLRAAAQCRHPEVEKLMPVRTPVTVT